MSLKDLTGQKFGKWTVLGRDESRKSNITYWLCKCDCGNPEIRSVARGSLTRGLSTSCGKCERKVRNHNVYDLSGDYGIGLTTNTNKEFYFDLEDYDKIKEFCWYENDNGYAVTQRNKKTIRMHRLILGLGKYDGIQVDHIHHNKLDNRKENLRLVSNAQNSWNKYCKGFYYDKSKNKFAARINANGTTIFKRFNTKEEAVEYRKALEKEYYKEYAYERDLLCE